METMIIRGVYKRNSRGRAYLVCYDRFKKRSIYRISAKLDARNGETLNVVGEIDRGWISVTSYYPCIFSRRLASKRKATAA